MAKAKASKTVTIPVSRSPFSRRETDKRKRCGKTRSDGAAIIRLHCSSIAFGKPWSRAASSDGACSIIRRRVYSLTQRIIATRACARRRKQSIVLQTSMPCAIKTTGDRRWTHTARAASEKRTLLPSKSVSRCGHGRLEPSPAPAIRRPRHAATRRRKRRRVPRRPRAKRG